MTTEATTERVRESGSSHRRGRPSSITIDGLTDDELDSIRAMLAGSAYCRVDQKGRVERVEAYDRDMRIEPKLDVALQPFWSDYTVGGRHANVQACPVAYHERPSEWEVPSLFVEAITAASPPPNRFATDPLTYERSVYSGEARRLERFGFICLRSRRGRGGRYHEIWMLPGFHSAKGRLAAALDGLEITDREGRLREAVRFLARECQFGALSVVIQKLGLCFD